MFAPPPGEAEERPGVMEGGGIACRLGGGGNVAVVVCCVLGLEGLFEVLLEGLMVVGVCG